MRSRRLWFVGWLMWCGLADPPTVSAQLAPLNFVYTGSGSQSDALKFSYEAGFFRKRGLDLTMLYVTSGITTSQTIVSGAASAATTTATDALRAIAAGAPMKIIMVNIDQFQHLFIARPEIKSAKDMKGKKIAVSRYGAFSDIQTRFVVRQWGMDPDKDVQIMQIGNSSARAAALASGGVDGAIVTPAFVPVARKVGLHVIFDLATIKTKFASQIMVAHDQTIKEKPELVRAVTTGFLDGIKAWKRSRNSPSLLSENTTKSRKRTSRAFTPKRIGFCAPPLFLSWKGFRTPGTASLNSRREVAWISRSSSTLASSTKL